MLPAQKRATLKKARRGSGRLSERHWSLMPVLKGDEGIAAGWGGAVRAEGAQRNALCCEPGNGTGEAGGTRWARGQQAPRKVKQGGHVIHLLFKKDLCGGR